MVVWKDKMAAAVIKTPSACGQKKTESHLTRGHLKLIRTCNAIHNLPASANAGVYEEKPAHGAAEQRSKQEPPTHILA